MICKIFNFAARTVISPDPNIETSEIGVPLVFARKLTFVEQVTAINYEKMRQRVINGPFKYPGATMILTHDKFNGSANPQITSLAVLDEGRGKLWPINYLMEEKENLFLDIYRMETLCS